MHRTRLLISTRTLPIRNLPILKCGATRVRNLMYLLDHGHPYAQPRKIHGQHDAFPKASDFGLTHTGIAAQEHAFVVMRHPTRRFLSLYFDKVMGDGTGRFKRMNQLLDKSKGFTRSPQTPLDHLKNCIALADVLEHSMQDTDYLPPNGHWAMQTLRLGVIKDCRLKVLLLENLDAQLGALLRDIVPDIDDHLSQLQGRNQSVKPVDPQELIIPALIDRIAEIYPRDQMLYEQAVDLWRGIDPLTATALDVPRLF